jgi:transposase
MSDSSVLRVTVGMSLEDVERTLITATLQAVGGSKTEAARLLGISLKTMYNRLHAYGDGCIRRKPMQSNGYDALVRDPPRLVGRDRPTYNQGEP